ncbi:MAG: carbonic anhydrase [Pseudomonadota bacterium]
MPDRSLEKLRAGYARFLSGRYVDQQNLYGQLGSGQSPHTMVIACADSRLDPVAIFDAKPGEVFEVRNVANLVPPYEVDGGLHGVSAALEFAVGVLEVRTIIVLGHAGCGGISACLAAADEGPVGEFIAPWVEIAAPARDRVLAAGSDRPAEELKKALEQEAIGESIDNLLTFPFVRNAVADERLKLSGAWFEVATAQLQWRDPQTGLFSEANE